jgi:UDP-glucose 4-epimerase
MRRHQRHRALNLLEAAASAGVKSFVFSSTTGAFGSHIYGTTKLMAENLCELFCRERGLPLVILRTSRFFPEDDDDAAMRQAYPPDNAQANELLYRPLDIADAVSAHLLAAERAPKIGFARYLVSATSAFEQRDRGLCNFARCIKCLPGFAGDKPI